MNWKKDFLLPYFNLYFIICFLLYFRELQVIPTDNYAMCRRKVLVSNTRSNSIVDEMALVGVETVLSQPFEKQLK